MRIVLPFPPSELFPNKANGKHWSSTRAIKDKYRDDSFYLTKQAGTPEIPETYNIPIRLLFVQPDRRGRDMDNMLAASKHALDGVAKALGVDDRRFKPMTLDWMQETGSGSLIVVVG